MRTTTNHEATGAGRAGRGLGAGLRGALAAMALLACAAGSPATAATEPGKPLPNVIFERPGYAIRLAAQVVQAPLELQVGLMFRLFVPPGGAMLFVMPSERIQSFWMRNTLIPLDMIFVNGQGVVVGIVHDATPLTEDPRYVRWPSRYVIEVPGGFTAYVGIRAGDRMRVEVPR